MLPPEATSIEQTTDLNYKTQNFTKIPEIIFCKVFVQLAIHVFDCRGTAVGPPRGRRGPAEGPPRVRRGGPPRTPVGSHGAHGATCSPKS